MSGASRRLGAAGVRIPPAVHRRVPRPRHNAARSSRASALLRDRKTLLCANLFFHIASRNSDVPRICFLSTSWDIQRTATREILPPGKYVNVPRA